VASTVPLLNGIYTIYLSNWRCKVLMGVNICATFVSKCYMFAALPVLRESEISAWSFVLNS